MASREIVLWIDERWYDALNRRISGETLKDRLEDYLDELMNRLIPDPEYERISKEIYRERMEQEAQRDASRRFSVFRVTEHGEQACFRVEAPLELYHAAMSLRRFIQAKDPSVSLRSWYSAGQSIGDDEFRQSVLEYIDGTDRVCGVFDIDMDRGLVLDLADSGGWYRHDLKAVCKAAYQAARKSTASPEEKLYRFKERLSLLEQHTSAPAECFLIGTRPLREEDISFSDDICEAEGLLDFYLDSFDGMDDVFGTHVCTAANEDYLNIYADYDLARGEVADALTVILCRGNGMESKLIYELTPMEKILLLPKMEQYCWQRMEMGLDEYRDRYLTERQQPSNADMGLSMG